MDLAMKCLESTKLAKDGDLPEHLHVLTKHWAVANTIRYDIKDLRMISIILILLLPLWIILVQLHQTKTVLSDIVNALMEYWLFLNWDKAKRVTNLTALAISASDCSLYNNYRKLNHTKAKCWAAGGGQEGKGPKWWKVPKSKEPRVSMLFMTAVTNFIQTITPGILDQFWWSKWPPKALKKTFQTIPKMSQSNQYSLSYQQISLWSPSHQTLNFWYLRNCLI